MPTSSLFPLFLHLPTRNHWSIFHVCTLVYAQSCLTLCNPLDCSPPDSSIHGISQEEYCSGWTFPIPREFSNTGIKLASPVALALQANSLPQSYCIGEALSLHSHLDNPYWYFPSVFIFAAVSNMLLVSSRSLSLAVTSLQLRFHLSIFPLISWILYHRNTQSTVLVLSSFLLLFFCQWVTFSCFLACVEIFLIGWCGGLVSKTCPITMTNYHVLLQGITLTWDQTCLSCIAGRIFTSEPPGKHLIGCWTLYLLHCWKSRIYFFFLKISLTFVLEFNSIILRLIFLWSYF